MLKCVVKFPTQISGQSGLTETELEDILSCDDDVLNDVYTYWTPPVRRLPPLLLVRLKADLGQYLGNWISESTLEHNHDEKERANIYVILFCYGCKKWVQYIWNVNLYLCMVRFIFYSWEWYISSILLILVVQFHICESAVYFSWAWSRWCRSVLLVPPSVYWSSLWPLLRRWNDQNHPAHCPGRFLLWNVGRRYVSLELYHKSVLYQACI